MNRRHFIQSAAVAAPLFSSFSFAKPINRKEKKQMLRLSLNTYSFNKELRDGSVTLIDLIVFCKDVGLEAIDPTGYYFPAYPTPSPDSYLFDFKRKTFMAGLEISGTGIRNDFTHVDTKSCNMDLILIDAWCEVASKIGAPLLRVFAGKEISDGRKKEEVMPQLISYLKKSSEIGARHGVMIALQNHNEFLKSSDEIIQVLKGVDSPWFGLHLDIGSLAAADAYEEIERLVKYAITWQIKEEVWEKGAKVPVDYPKLFDIIKNSDYSGYLPLETLNANPKEKIPLMIEEIKKLL